MACVCACVVGWVDALCVSNAFSYVCVCMHSVRNVYHDHMHVFVQRIQVSVSVAMCMCTYVCEYVKFIS